MRQNYAKKHAHTIRENTENNGTKNQGKYVWHLPTRAHKARNVAVGHGRRIIVGLEFGENIGAVLLDGALGTARLFGNFHIRPRIGKQACDAPFGRRK